MKKSLSVVFIVLLCSTFFISAPLSGSFVVYGETKELIDESTGIKVSGNFSIDADLNTARITDGVKYRQAKIALKEISEGFLLYGVGLSTPVTGLETFTIFLPIPNGIDPEDCEIYRITNTTATKLIASRSTTHISFSGNDFGTFAVTYLKITSIENQQGLTPTEIALISVGSVFAAALVGLCVSFIVKRKKRK